MTAMANHTVSVGAVADAALQAELEKGLTEHAREAGMAPFAKQPLTVAMRDDEGALIGGLVGEAMWGWLFVRLLWVKKDHRGSGHGEMLLARAEREAALRGCHGVYLDTFDFQARGFYEKLGYYVFGKIDEYPRDHCRYYMAKALTPP
jgi:ribosomal protein S18 acetylase RimI-like enzyme